MGVKRNLLALTREYMIHTRGSYRKLEERLCATLSLHTLLRSITERDNSPCSDLHRASCLFILAPKSQFLILHPHTLSIFSPSSAPAVSSSGSRSSTGSPPSPEMGITQNKRGYWEEHIWTSGGSRESPPLLSAPPCYRQLCGLPGNSWSPRPPASNWVEKIHSLTQLCKRCELNMRIPHRNEYW